MISYLKQSDQDLTNMTREQKRVLKDYPNAKLSIMYQSFSDRQIDYKWDYFKATLNLKTIKKEDFDLSIDRSKKVKYEILFATKFKDIVE